MKNALFMLKIVAQAVKREIDLIPLLTFLVMLIVPYVLFMSNTSSFS